MKKIFITLLVFALLLSSIRVIGNAQAVEANDAIIISTNNKNTFGLVETAEEEKVFCEATVEDNFAEGRVLVVMKRGATTDNVNKSSVSYTTVQERAMAASSAAENFAALENITIEAVTDLSAMASYATTAGDTALMTIGENEEDNISDEYAYLNADNFHQILQIDIAEPGKEAVLEAIRQLEEREDVLFASPDYIISVENTQSTAINEMVPETTATMSAVEAGDEQEWLTIDQYPQYALDNIDWDKAWELMPDKPPTVLVGVMDSGIDITHPDLEGQVNII